MIWLKRLFSFLCPHWFFAILSLCVNIKLVTELTRMSCDDSPAYALQSLWNSPHSAACDDTHNAGYCHINRQTLFNRNPVCCLHIGGPANEGQGEAEPGTCIRGLGWPPSTAALIQNSRQFPLSIGTGLDWISQDPSATFSEACRSHAAFQQAILHGLSEFIPTSLQQTDSSWDFR